MVALQAWGSLTVLFGVSLASTEPKSAFPASGAGMLCGKRRKNISARRMACSVPGAVWPPRGSALMEGGGALPRLRLFSTLRKQPQNPPELIAIFRPAST